MEELKFATFEDAMNHLASISGCKGMVAAKSAVKNPRTKPKGESEKKNWDKKDMWGDPKNHKYPLFNNKTGQLCARRAKSALRYLNQAKSKASYPSSKARSQVLARIVRAILKADPNAKVDYQARDKTYQALPESVKKKMKGYKMASMEEEVEMAMRIAKEDKIDTGETLQDIKAIKENLKDVILDKKMSTLGLSGNDLVSMTPRQLLDLISQRVSDEDVAEEGITEEEVMSASHCASEAQEIKDDLIALIKKASSQKYDRTLKQILGTINMNKVTVAELLDMLRGAIAKADEEEPAAQDADVALEG